MSHTVYIGNLEQSVSRSAVEELFSQIGDVTAVKIIVDPQTNLSKGYGFVEMSSGREVDAAIKQFNGTIFQGSMIKVNQAQQRKKKGARSRRVGY